MSILKDLAKGIKWSFISQVGRQVLQLITTAVLVSLLPPKDFGLMGIALIVTGFLNILENPGTSASVIQKSETTEKFLSSIFWLNILLGIIFTAIVYLSGPIAADFFQESRVDNLLKYLSVMFLVSAFGNLQKGLAEKRNQFDLLALIEFLAILMSSLLAILSAIEGFGVYSLVLQSLTLTFVRTILLLFLVKWKPYLYFNWSELKPVLHYTLNLTGANIWGYIMRSADNLIIGKYLGAESLGYYTIAYKIMIYPLQNIVDMVKRVLFPILSRMQNDMEESRNIYLNITYVVFLIICPLMLGIFAINEKLVMTLWGEEWESVITLIYFLAPLGILQSFIRMSGSILAANGKANLLFYINMFNAIIIISAFLIGVNWGLTGIATAYLIANIIVFYPSVKLPFKIIGVDVIQVLETIKTTIIPSIIMLIGVFTASYFLRANTTINLVLMVLLGIFIFSLVAWKENLPKLRTIYGLLRDNK